MLQSGPPKLFQKRESLVPPDITHLIRSNQKKGILSQKILEEAERGIINSESNTFKFYYVINPEPQKTKKSVEKIKDPSFLERKFHSIHKMADGKTRKLIASRIEQPVYSQLEKKAITNIQKTHGKLYLLSDLY